MHSSHTAPHLWVYTHTHTHMHIYTQHSSLTHTHTMMLTRHFMHLLTCVTYRYTHLHLYCIILRQTDRLLVISRLPPDIRAGSNSMLLNGINKKLTGLHEDLPLTSFFCGTKSWGLRMKTCQSWFDELNLFELLTLATSTDTVACVCS